jgi:hypothetical protein
MHCTKEALMPWKKVKRDLEFKGVNFYIFTGVVVTSCHGVAASVVGVTGAAGDAVDTVTAEAGRTWPTHTRSLNCFKNNFLIWIKKLLLFIYKV